ncbi:MAG TPA: nitrophenyl compound nitroreductase subunit ArsF family protein [Phycisphaerae bacterium]|mgnify:CR=1 FL=1|nr:nitrophenyl compound nitroreductase subunit ArsF family protein [Phycisphaerae bacterium]
MKVKKALSNVLLAFLLVSIGYAVGRETAPVGAGKGSLLVPSSGSVQSPTASGEVAVTDQVMVYYLHGIPCITCTMIDTTAEALVRDEFAAEVASGRVAYASLNYLDRENESLADKYNVGSNMVIAVRVRDGLEVQRVRLDRVMELAGDREQLADYIRHGIRACLEGGRQ